MVQKIYTVTDLGPGDGGKGGIVHKVATMMKAHTVIKVGAFQGSHGVSTSRGESFAFSQWGCATFEGIRTHISKRFVVSPEGILNEGNILKYECGVQDPYELLTVDEDTLCGTPYHGFSSRIREMARGNNPRGTIGTGAGVAVRDAQRFPDLAIYTRDLLRADLRDLIAANREQVQKDLEQILQGDFLSEDQEELRNEIALLRSDAFFKQTVRRFREAGKRTKIVDSDYLRTNILSQDGVAVVESSHGILTDRYRGFHPHTSANRTLPSFTLDMLKDAGYTGKIIKLGITRAYQIRHGAGPLPTDDPAWVEDMLPGSHKPDNRYQGRVRIGALDLVLLRYAIAQSGGPSAYDGLAITWFDQIQKEGTWKLCGHYQNANDQTYFASPSEIRVRMTDDEEQIAYQEQLGKQLLHCTPNINRIHFDEQTSRDRLFEICNVVLKESLGIPVRMVSFGPTELDKLAK